MKGIRKAPLAKCSSMMGESGRSVPVNVQPQRKQPPPAVARLRLPPWPSAKTTAVVSSVPSEFPGEAQDMSKVHEVTRAIPEQCHGGLDVEKLV